MTGPVLEENTVCRFSFKITAAQMADYGRLSGDLNPLHVDPAYARKQGFNGPVVYGGLLVAMISNVLGMKLPGAGWIWHSLAIQFKNPLYVDETAELVVIVEQISEAVGVARLKLTFQAGDRCIATGTAQTGRLRS